MLINFDDLSNAEVRDGVLRLRSLERQCEVDLLLHLIELEKRDLHLAWGYSSLFTYLVNALGYSEACASRRVRISRLIGKHPEIVSLLRSGLTNLSSLSLISKVLESETIEVGNKLLAQISSKPCREVEELALAYKPEVPRPREYIKPVKVIASRTKAKLEKEENLTNLFCNLQGSSNGETPIIEPELEIRYEVRCSLSQKTKSKLSKAQDLMVHKLKGDMVLENVFNELIDCYLAKHSKDRKVRKINRARKAEIKESDTTSKRETISASVKREVFARDKFCCSYCSEDGIKCSKTSNLELDHILPAALGGDNTVTNLRVVCREHNQFLARSVFGREFIERKVQTSSI